jgi:hypothetical protein
MGNTSETLPGAGSGNESDEALLTGPESPTEPKAKPTEQGDPPPESPPPEAPEEEEEGETEAGEEEEPEPKAAKPDGEGEEEVEESLAEGEVPDDIKAVFQQEGVGAKIRDMFYRDRAYREVFATVNEAREVKELLPDGVKSAKELLEVAERIEPFEEAFEMAMEGPEGATEFWKAVYNQDPTAYQNLHNMAAENILHHFNDQAQKAQDENLIAAVDVLWRRLNGKEYTGRAAPQGDLRESNLKEREQALESRELNGFKQAALAQTDNRVRKLITTHVDKVLKDSSVPKGAKQRIIDDIDQEIRGLVADNRTLKVQLNRAFRNGNRGERHLESIVSIVVNRARSLLGDASRGVIKEWTGSYLSQTNKQRERQRISRADVGTGGPPGQPSGALPTPAKVDYSKMSDEELLTASEIATK